MAHASLHHPFCYKLIGSIVSKNSQKFGLLPTDSGWSHRGGPPPASKRASSPTLPTSPHPLTGPVVGSALPHH